MCRELTNSPCVQAAMRVAMERGPGVFLAGMAFGSQKTGAIRQPCEVPLGRKTPSRKVLPWPVLPQSLLTPWRGCATCQDPFPVPGGRAERGLERPGRPPLAMEMKSCPFPAEDVGEARESSCRPSLLDHLSSLDSKGLHLENCSDSAVFSPNHADHPSVSGFELSLDGTVKPGPRSWTLRVSFW